MRLNNDVVVVFGYRFDTISFQDQIIRKTVYNDEDKNVKEEFSEFILA